MADGGEGTLDLFGGGDRSSPVTSADGTLCLARWLLRDDRTAVLESAEACGLEQSGGASRNDAWRATSRGVGELIVAATDIGAEKVLLGLGGSATSDGGQGAYEVLRAAYGTRLPLEVVVCCDVDVPFTAAGRVFGPQKGAGHLTVLRLGRRLRAQRRAFARDHGVDVDAVPGSGAAGGLAGALAVLGAQLVPGFAVLGAELGLSDAIHEADLVVTGEGRFDATSLRGKVTGGVLDLCRQAGVPALVVAGSVDPAVRARVGPDAEVVDLTQRFGAARARSSTAACVERVVAERLGTTSRLTTTLPGGPDDV
jgi:glycerate kinase